MEEQCAGPFGPQFIVVWREGKWRCELHALPGLWRFHLYRGDDLLAVRALTGEDAFERAEALRQCIRR